MSVSIVVPFGDDGGERTRNWNWLRARYEELYPDWEIVEGTSGEPWSKGTAVNSAVARASGDVVVIADADVMVGAHVLTKAIEALSDAPWVIPHNLVYRLSERTTLALLNDALAGVGVRRLPRKRLERTVRQGPPGGGMVVTRTEHVRRVNGIDERFYGWGGEDISFARALDTLIGPHLRLDEVMWHLHHEPMSRRPGNRASADSEALAARYLDANGNVETMAALCAEKPYEGTIGGGMIVTQREAVQQVPLDPRFNGWGQEDQSWGIALTCVLGQPQRDKAPLVHLHHPPSPLRASRGRGSAANRALRRRYTDARRDPEQMRSLLEEVHALHPDIDALHDRPARVLG